MPIIYALVARGATVLAEHASTTGNFAKVTQSILEKIPSTNSKMSYVYDRYGREGFEVRQWAGWSFRVRVCTRTGCVLGVRPREVLLRVLLCGVLARGCVHD